MLLVAEQSNPHTQTSWSFTQELAKHMSKFTLAVTAAAYGAKPPLFFRGRAPTRVPNRQRASPSLFYSTMAPTKLDFPCTNLLHKATRWWNLLASLSPNLICTVHNLGIDLMHAKDLHTSRPFYTKTQVSFSRVFCPFLWRDLVSTSSLIIVCRCFSCLRNWVETEMSASWKPSQK